MHLCLAVASLLNSCNLKSSVKIDHSSTNFTFQILNITQANDGTSQIKWSPLEGASKYRVNLTSENNCTSVVVSLDVKDTYLSFDPNISSSKNLFACVYGISGANTVISSAKNNPYLILQNNTLSTTSSSSTSSTSSSSSSSTKASTNSTPAAKSLYSYVNLLVGDSTITGCLRGSTQGIGGPALSAGVGSPGQISVDGSGNIIFWDSERILMIPATSGTYYGQVMKANYMYTVIGDDNHLFQGGITNGAPAFGQLFPANGGGLTLDINGNIIFTASASIYLIAKNSGTYFGQSMTGGFVYLIAGGTAGTSGDGGPALSAHINLAATLASDSLGNLYIADYYNNRIQMIPVVAGTYFGQVMTANYMYTIAGNSGGTSGNAGAGGVLGTSTNIGRPQAITVDGTGNVFFEDSNQYLYMLAANSGTFFGQAMTSAYIYSLASSVLVYSLAADSAGNIYYGNDSHINMLPAASGTFFGQSMVMGTFYRIAGHSDGTAGCTVSGSATSSGISVVFGLAIDSHGNVVFSQNRNGLVSVIPASSGTYYSQSMTSGNVYNIAGVANPAANSSYTLGPALGTSIPQTNALAYDSSKNLYIGTPISILMVPATSGTYFGQTMTANFIYSIASHPANSIAVDLNGNVVFTGYAGVSVLAASSNTFYGTAMTIGQIYEISGAGASQASGVPIANALFTNPFGVGIDGTGNLYIADSGYNRIVMIPVTSGTFLGQAMTANYAYTVAGGNGSGDTGVGGVATSAMLNQPSSSIAIDSSSNVYFSDRNRVLMIPAVSGTYFSQSMTANYLYVIAGSAAGSYQFNRTAPTGILGTSAIFFSGGTTYPMPVAVDHLGNVYFSEQYCSWIHMVPQVSGSYFNQSMTAGYFYTLNNPLPVFGYSASGTLASVSNINYPTGLAIDSLGNVAFTEQYNPSVRVITIPQ